MTSKLDPSRWIENGPQQARAAIEQARAQLGRADDVARLRTRLGSLAESANASASAAAGARHGLGRASWMLKLGAVALLAAIGVSAWRSTAAPTHRASMPSTKAASRQPLAPGAHEQPAALVGETPAPAALEPRQATPLRTPDAEHAREPERTQVRSRRVAKLARGPAESEPAADGESAAPAASAAEELKLLMSAQDALDASPQRALRLLEEHARDYPHGNFVQERESLAIDALRKLGLATDARTRALAFIERFPGSTHARRIERWLASERESSADHKLGGQGLPTH